MSFAHVPDLFLCRWFVAVLKLNGYFNCLWLHEIRLSGSCQNSYLSSCCMASRFLGLEHHLSRWIVKPCDMCSRMLLTILMVVTKGIRGHLTQLSWLMVWVQVGIVKKGRLSAHPSVTDCWWRVGIWWVLPVYSARSGEQSGMAQSISWLALLLENFAIMRGAAAAVHLPQLKVKVLTTTNNPLHLKNDFVKYLHEKQLGWSIDTVELPYYPVCTLWDVGLWLYCSVFYNNRKWLLQWEALINKTKNKKSLVPCLILLMALGQKPVIKFVWPYVLAPFTRSTLNCHINSIL